MNIPNFNDRIEKKYQVGISESEVAGLWRDLRAFLGPYGLVPVQEITSVGSVYLDNKDCDLLRYCLFGRLMLVRVRAYEMYGRPPEPITEYWVEVKTTQGARRKNPVFKVDNQWRFRRAVIDAWLLKILNIKRKSHAEVQSRSYV